MMKSSPLVSATAVLMFLCVIALFSQTAYSASLFKGQEKIIYHQTMTPKWLEAHASFIDSSRTTTAEQITFNSGSVKSAALLKVPIIPAGLCHYTSPLTVKIVVSNDVSIGSKYDSDIAYAVSDGVSFVGFKTVDKHNYQGDNLAPCYGHEGTSGATKTATRSISPNSPRPTDTHYPGQFVITLKLDERWGSCYTSHDGGFLKTAASYNKRLMLNRGLTLEVYKEDIAEKVGIKSIEVTVIQDN